MSPWRAFGRTGVKVSPLTLGAMNLGVRGNPDHDDAIKIVHRALDAGINVIDTADYDVFLAAYRGRRGRRIGAGGAIKG
jgi:predicted aldo/keto reductase-like oxidoreductase